MKKIECHAEKTTNLGNYENIKIGMTQSVTLKEGENEQKVRQDLMDELLNDILDYSNQIKTQSEL